MSENDIDVVVKIDVDDIVGLSLEGFLNLLEEKAVGDKCLMDVRWKAEPDPIAIRVWGYTEDVDV